MVRLFFAFLIREILLIGRSPWQWLMPVVFFVMASQLFPLTLDYNDLPLAYLAPGVIWFNGLLAIFLSSQHALNHDLETGTLEQWLISGQPLSVMVLARIIGQWSVTNLTLIVALLVVSLTYHMPLNMIGPLIASLVLGTPALYLICWLAQALVLPSYSSGVLMALMIMPLATPVLIFGSGVAVAARLAWPIMPNLAILGALSLITMSTVPGLIHYVLQFNIAAVEVQS